MAKKGKTRIETLRDACEAAEPPFTVNTYSPGDGVTRYRFGEFRCDRCSRKMERDSQGRLSTPIWAFPLICPMRHARAGHQSDYFSMRNDYTALGYKEAVAYATGRGAVL